MSNRLSISMCMALVAGAGVVVGCHHGHGKVHETTEVVVEQPGPPPDQIVYAEPPPPAREVVIIREAPPPVIVEAVPPAPVFGMVWVGGYWVHDHGHYAWCRGRYVRPVPGHRFEPARWEHTRRGYEFHGERWAPEGGHGRGNSSGSQGHGGSSGADNQGGSGGSHGGRGGSGRSG